MTIPKLVGSSIVKRGWRTDSLQALAPFHCILFLGVGWGGVCLNFLTTEKIIQGIYFLWKVKVPLSSHPSLLFPP